MKALSYEERAKKELDYKQELFITIQARLKKEKLNLYGFKIFICDPLSDNSRFNTSRGFFTSAYLTFKNTTFGNISPNFNIRYPRNLPPAISVDSFHVSGFPGDILGLINYSRIEQHLEELVVKRDGYQCLQEFIDEMEKFRQEIVKFYSI